MKAVTLISLLTLSMSCASTKINESRSKIKKAESKVKNRINSVVNYRFTDLFIDRKR